MFDLDLETQVGFIDIEQGFTEDIAADNIENLEYIDLRGINYLLYTYEVCKNNHGRSLLCGINSEVKDKIKTSRLLNYMIETKDELSALKIMNI